MQKKNLSGTEPVKNDLLYKNLIESLHRTLHLNKIIQNHSQNPEKKKEKKKPKFQFGFGSLITQTSMNFKNLIGFSNPLSL